ncbi:hypothetical protein BDV12DRAFT_166824 [Aspergillus spectabilis]
MSFESHAMAWRLGLAPQDLLYVRRLREFGPPVASRRDPDPCLRLFLCLSLSLSLGLWRRRNERREQKKTRCVCKRRPAPCSVLIS